MLWIKAFHIVAIVAWFAGLFYLPRLFAYHADTQDSLGQERFKLMERRLYTIIMNPAAGFSIALGLLLLMLTPHNLSQGWMHVKLMLVAVLIADHFYCGYLVRQFRLNKNTKPARYYKIISEIPTLLLISIVILVVVKPF